MIIYAPRLVERAGDQGKMITFGQDIRDAVKLKRRVMVRRWLAVVAGLFFAFVAGLLIDVHINEIDVEVIDLWVSLPFGSQPTLPANSLIDEMLNPKAG